MFKNFLKAARLRTLPLSVSGIIVGSFLGVNSILDTSLKEVDSNLTYFIESHIEVKSSLMIFFLAILTTIGFQILSNFANDYGDGVKGADKNREGEARMVASGVISPQQMKIAMIVQLFLHLLSLYH